MYIVVVGGGRVGYYLVKTLLNEGHEVVIVEKNPAYCKIINDELGGVCIRGDGCEASILAEVGTSRADMFVAVTGDDDDNLVACQVAKHKFNVPRTIARIRNPQNETIFKILGIDVTVSSTSVILEHIQEQLPTHPLTHLLPISEKGLEIVEVRVSPESTVVGKRIRDIRLPEGTQFALVIPQSDKPFVPNSDTVIQPNDRMVATINPEGEEELRDIMRGKPRE